MENICIDIKPCCCNCKHQLKLMKHPSNKDFGKGSISESCGYVCTVQFGDGSNEGKGIFRDSEHGLCELHKARLQSLTNAPD